MNRTYEIIPVNYCKLWAKLEYLEKDGNRISASTLFSELGISSETSYAMKKGYNISMKTIDKLCSYFQCQPCDLMDFVPDFKPE